MPATIIVDTGPLVALCNRLDPGNAACVAALRRLPQYMGLVITLAVVTEAMYLLGKVSGGRMHLFRLLAHPPFTVDALPMPSLVRLQALMTRYADLPMDFADATVVELAERLGTDTVFTLDERDFRVYQPRHVPHFRLLPADL